MTVLHIDFETRSAADLKEVGLDNYAADPTTDVWCMGWTLGDDEAYLAAPPFGPGASRNGKFLEYALKHVQAGDLVVAHNVAFELAIWNNVMVPRYGWPELKPEQCECTMAMAYAMGLPATLERAAAAVGIKQQKDMAGHRLMLQMCRPKTDGTWHDEPDKLARLYEYCKQDVEVERELYKRLVRLSEKERRVWLLDYKINRRGIQVDLPAVKAASEMVLHEQDRLNQAIRSATGNVVGFTTEVARITKWVQSRGVEIDGLAKADVLDALGGELPDDVRTVLEIRREAGRSSTAKLNAILTAAGPDGRVRGTMQYHGAGTGRWAGRVIQPHNMPRPKLKPKQADAAIGLIVSGKHDLLEMLYGNLMGVAADCLRGMIVPSPGNDLLAGDFANIEGRVLAWLAGEEWKLQAFRDFDAGAGPDVYCATYGKSFGVDPNGIDKDAPERQVGKVEELAFGFQGALGAWRTMEAAYPGTPALSDAEVENIKNLWRKAHPMIEKYWYAAEEAAVSAVLNPGRVFAVGPKGREVRYKKVGSFLWYALPSGRALCYPYPKILEIDTPWGDRKDALTYMKVLDKNKANKDKIIPDPAAQGDWQRVATYGGKLAENNTQAVARDILADALLRLDDAGFDLTMHVHDEAVAEVSAQDGPWLLGRPRTSIEFEVCMAQVPDWAAGLPIAVETWRGKRYRK